MVSSSSMMKMIAVVAALYYTNTAEAVRLHALEEGFLAPTRDAGLETDSTFSEEDSPRSNSSGVSVVFREDSDSESMWRQAASLSRGSSEESTISLPTSEADFQEKCHGCETTRRQTLKKLITKVATMPKYSFAEYSDKVVPFLETLSETAISDVGKLAHEDLLYTRDTEKVRKDVFSDLAKQNLGGTYSTEYIDKALRIQQYVNRAAVLENEIAFGDFSTTMSFKSQTMMMTILLKELEQLQTKQSLPGRDVLFAGCGIGDWAVETALAVPDSWKVTCWNTTERVRSMGLKAFKQRPADQVFDMDLLENDYRNASSTAQQVPQLAGGKALAERLHASEHKLKFVCTQNDPACSYWTPDGRALTSSQVQETGNLFGARDGKYDVIQYGNALVSSELKNVRDALRDENSFGIVAVCEEMQDFSHETEGAPFYCQGKWKKVTKNGTDKVLWPFKKVMRPRHSANKQFFNDEYYQIDTTKTESRWMDVSKQ